jgi:hypothetical protein
VATHWHIFAGTNRENLYPCVIHMTSNGLVWEGLQDLALSPARRIAKYGIERDRQMRLDLRSVGHWLAE